MCQKFLLGVCLKLRYVCHITFGILVLPAYHGDRTERWVRYLNSNLADCRSAGHLCTVGDRWHRLRETRALVSSSKVWFLHRVVPLELSAWVSRPVSLKTLTGQNDPVIPDSLSTHIMTVGQPFTTAQASVEALSRELIKSTPRGPPVVV